MAITDDFLRTAIDSIRSGNLDAAKRILDGVLRGAGRDWKAFRRSAGTEVVYCWTSEEFVAYSDYRARIPSSRPHPIVWKAGSYSHAFYLLALLEMERQNPAEALRLLTEAAHLEPDHPDILCLQAFALRQLGRVEEAIASYRLALTRRPWALPTQQARAWRGLGSSLIDAEQFDEAEAALDHSLTLEPDSRMAWLELDYIRETRNERQAQSIPDRNSRISRPSPDQSGLISTP